jgi:RNA polymerase sigma factor (sigma-70 family)
MERFGENHFMTKGSLGEVLLRIRGLVGPGGVSAPSDAQLVALFADRRDEASFAELVRRHGGLVLGVCRRVLDDYHAAEDAFQATFLVLARKAASIRKRQLVASWLFGVAYRIAGKARAAMARRRAREQEWCPRPRVDPTADLVWRELRPVLDEEVSRLPDKYRQPVVLCYLENKSNVEAARQLGWSKGTVSGRLARARALLRARLTRRGLALSGGVFAAALAQKATAAVPPALGLSTVKAAALVAAGSAAPAAAVSASVTALAQGAVQAMLMTKIKIVTALVLTIGVLGTGAAFFTSGVLGQGPAGAASEKAAAARPLDGARTDQGADEDNGKDDPAQLKKEIAALKKELALTKKKLRELLRLFELERARAEAERDQAKAARLEARAQRQKAEAELRRATETAAQAEGAARREAEARRKVAEDALRRAQEAVAQAALSDGLVARSAQSLKEIGIALHAYYDVHGRFPAHAIYDKDGNALLSWRVAILPFIDQKALYNQFRLHEPWDSPHNKKLIPKMPRIYGPLANADNKKYMTSYQVFVGAGTLFDGSAGLRIADVPDGTSNTIAAVEAGKAVIWTRPLDLAYSPNKPLPKLGGAFKNGFHILFADGGVSFVKLKYDEKKMRYAILRNDGEPLDVNTLDK